MGSEAEPQRLQKVLAAAGLGSRRACEELIAEGRVTVAGEPVTLGARADPRAAVIHVDGARVVTDDRMVYLAVNKPSGVLSAMSDDRGRPTLAGLVPDAGPRLFHVGRLDADSEGLLLVSNDGDLSHRLTHPSYGIPKTYLCEVSGPLPREVGRRLLAGVELEDGPARADEFRVVDSLPSKALVEIVIHEGRNRIVRRMLTEVGHPVGRLIRTRIGPIRLGELRPGTTRSLSLTEVGALYQAVGL
ncbi:MAG: pseudouridine synthase [Micromonosporaceae bacterium]|nr:pseudouridine synthase [Micromonosporaceae bacterium]